MTRVGVRVAVVEHVTIGAVAAVPAAGEIVHLDAPRAFPGGGGGVALYQLLRAPASDAVLLFTALGDDDAGRFVGGELARTRAQVFAART